MSPKGGFAGPGEGRPPGWEVRCGSGAGAGPAGGSGDPGDPESPLRWTTKSTAEACRWLTPAGHPVSPDTVERLLKQDGYSLQGNAKTVEGKQHPDRDGQFRHINELVSAFQAGGRAGDLG